jgi:WD40 repeat protein
VLLQSAKPLYAIRVSPDGKLAAAAGAEGRITFFAVPSLNVERVIETGQIEVNSLGFSHDGSRIASAGDDGSVAVWDVTTGREIERYRAHDKPVFHVLFTNAENSLLTASADSKIRFWSGSRSAPVRELTEHTASIETVAQSRLGTIAAGSADWRVSLWPADGSQLLWIFDDYPRSKVNAVAFAPSGEILATGHDDGILTIRRPDTGVLIAQQEFPESIHAIAYSPDRARDGAAWMAIGDRGGTVHLLPVDNRSSHSGMTATASSRQRGRQWHAHLGRIYAMAFTPDGSQLLTTGEDGVLKAWTLDTSQNSRRLPPRVNDFAVTSQHGVIVSGDLAAEFDSDTGALRRGFPLVSQPTRRVRYLTDAQQILFTDSQGALISLAMDDGKPLWDLRAEEDERVNLVAASPDGRSIAAEIVDREGPTRRIDLVTASQRIKVDCPELIHALEMTADGRSVIYDEVKDIRVIDFTTGKLVHTLAGHRSTIWRLAVSPDGKHLASCSRDRTVRVWDLETGRELWSEIAHSNDTEAVAFSPDGETVATSGGDGMLRLWRWRRGTLVLEYPLIDWPGTRLAFSPDGTKLMVLAAERLRIYDASAGAPGQAEQPAAETAAHQ